MLKGDSSHPVSSALGALGIKAGVPRAGWRSSVVLNAIAAQSVIREHLALAVISLSFPLPEANSTLRRRSAAHVMLDRDVGSVACLHVVHKASSIRGTNCS